jgi:hypothetical protein
MNWCDPVPCSICGTVGHFAINHDDYVVSTRATLRGVSLERGGLGHIETTQPIDPSPGCPGCRSGEAHHCDGQDHLNGSI